MKKLNERKSYTLYEFENSTAVLLNDVPLHDHQGHKIDLLATYLTEHDIDSDEVTITPKEYLPATKEELSDAYSTDFCAIQEMVRCYVTVNNTTTIAYFDLEETHFISKSEDWYTYRKTTHAA